MFSKTKEAFGGLHIVCNNAGIGDEKKWRLMIEINLVGACMCVDEVYMCAHACVVMCVYMSTVHVRTHCWVEGHKCVL